MISDLSARGRNPPRFAGLCGDAIGYTLYRDRFRIAAARESGPLSLLANDVVEYQNDAVLAREDRIVFCCEIRRSRAPDVALNLCGGDAKPLGCGLAGFAD